MVDILGSLSSVLEQVSQDKVKTGLLGSLGIGTASPLSIGWFINLLVVNNNQL